MGSWLRHTLLALALAGAAACDDRSLGEGLPHPQAPELRPPDPVLRRLTADQYRNIIHDVFGSQVSIVTALPEYRPFHGLVAEELSNASLVTENAEQYESAAYQVAEQTVSKAAVRDRALPCDPRSTADRDCYREIVESLGFRLWRRPLNPGEVLRVTGVGLRAAQTLADPDAGVEYIVAALLQSPYFLYRVELGEPDPNRPDRYRFTAYEYASRLSFLLTNSTPDEALLLAAEDGRLDTPEGVEEQVDRLLESPAAREGTRAFFDDMLRMWEIEGLAKDTNIFAHFTSEVEESARTETELAIEHHVHDADADYRDLFTTRTTFVDRKLASMYGLRAPAREGFGMVTLPNDGTRRGLLGHISLLSAHAHPVSSSATKRGVFIFKNVLCKSVPPPPANLNTGIPDPDPTLRTLRQRLAKHAEVEPCKSCHVVTDGLGLGLENYDGLGMWRETENGAAIDASGVVDGERFRDAWELGQVLHDNPRVTDCVATNLLTYAGGYSIDGSDRGNPEWRDELLMLDWLNHHFRRQGYRHKALLRTLALSPRLRELSHVGYPEP